MSKIIIVSLLLVAFKSQALLVDVTLTKDRSDASWRVDYTFSEPVSELSFEYTPYAYVDSAWSVKSDGGALDMASLRVLLDTPQKSLSVKVSHPYDLMVRGFYTPFLNFTDGGNALFVAYYFPARIKYNGGWEELDLYAKRLTIRAPEGEAVWFDRAAGSAEREVTTDQIYQYAYVGGANVHHADRFDILLDDGLPEWIRAAYLKAIPELMLFYQNKMNAVLPFKPLFLVNFKSDPGYPRIDGGAINKQVAVNIVGDGWHQDPENNLVNTLSLMAHEISHLWNAQYWHTSESTPIWMLEGGANYFTQKALLNLGYITLDDYSKNVIRQVDACEKLLNNNAFNQWPNYADHYTCGEAIFYLGDAMLSNPKELELWQLIVDNLSGSSYTQVDFVKALESVPVDAPDIKALKSLLAGESQWFAPLIDKYLR